jgi:hypothetical protein
MKKDIGKEMNKVEKNVLPQIFLFIGWSERVKLVNSIGQKIKRRYAVKV